MTTEEIWGQSAMRAFNDLHALFEDDQLQECVDQAQELLESNLPRHFRIKVLVLLATAAEDWHDSESCRSEAEMLWSMFRWFNPKGADESIDAALAEHCKSLDSLKAALDEERAELDLNEDGNDQLHPAEAELGEGSMNAPKNLERTDRTQHR